jgi:predicted metal-dependent phosphoesterase TrpH
MVARLNELGAPVSWDDVSAVAGDAPVGRPHVAQALVARGVVPEFDAAFTPEWIGFGGRAYVPKRSLEPVHAVRMVEAAGGVSVLAHPGAIKRGTTLSDDHIAGLAAVGLGGIEVDHPDHDAPTRQRLRGLARDVGLLVTGSSDDHGELTGHRLGCETTSPDTYAALVAGAEALSPVRG